MRVFIGADHAGFELKQKLVPFIEGLGHIVLDKGAYEKNPDDDYPDFVLPVAKGVSEGESEDRGIVIGSSGQGEAMVANKYPGIRAMVYYSDAKPLPNSAKVGEGKGPVIVSREDNDSNVLSLGASFLTPEDAERVVRLWLETPFPGEERHKRRIAKLDSALGGVCIPGSPHYGQEGKITSEFSPNPKNKEAQ